MRYTSFFFQRVARLAAPRAASSALLTSESASNPLGSHSSRSPHNINVLNNLKKNADSTSNQSQLAIENFVSMVRRLQHEKKKQLMKRLECASLNPSDLSLADKARKKKYLRMRATNARLQIAKKRMGALNSNRKVSTNDEIVLEKQLEKALEDEKKEELMLVEEKKKQLLEKTDQLKMQKSKILEEKKRHLEEQATAKRLRMELTAFKVFEKLIERFQIQRYKEVQTGIRQFQNQELAEAKAAAAEAEEKAAALKAANQKEKNTVSSPVDIEQSSAVSVRAVNEAAGDLAKEKGQLLDMNKSTSARSLSSSKKEEKKLAERNIPLSNEEKALNLVKKRIQRLEALSTSDSGKQNDSKTVEEKVKELLKVSLLLKKTAASLRSPIGKQEEREGEQDNKTTKASSLKRNGSDKSGSSEGSKNSSQQITLLTETSGSEKEKADINGDSLKTKTVKKSRAESPVSGSDSALSETAAIRSSPDATRSPFIPKNNKTSTVEKKKSVAPAAQQVKRMVKTITSPPIHSAAPKVLLSRNPAPIPLVREAESGETAFRVDNARREYFTLLEQEKERKFAIAAAERSGASAALPNVRRADLSWAVPVGSGGLFRL